MLCRPIEQSKGAPEELFLMGRGPPGSKGLIK